ncbi:hypothetical protein D3C85_1441710 [compost metagenome]
MADADDEGEAMALTIPAVHPLQLRLLVRGQHVQAGAGLFVDGSGGQATTAHRLGGQFGVAVEEGFPRFEVAGPDARHHGIVQCFHGRERPGLPGILGDIGRVFEDIAERLDELILTHRIDRCETGGLLIGLGHGR